jgi:hypothetical protein
VAVVPYTVTHPVAVVPCAVTHSTRNTKNGTCITGKKSNVAVFLFDLHVVSTCVLVGSVSAIPRSQKFMWRRFRTRFSIFMGRVVLIHITYEGWTDRVFRNVCSWSSDSGNHLTETTGCFETGSWNSDSGNHPTETTGCAETSALEVETPGITQQKEQDVPKRLILKLRLRESPNRKNRVFRNVGSWSSDSGNHPTERTGCSETSALEVETPGITQQKEQDVPKRLLLKLRLRESPNRKNRVFRNVYSWSSDSGNHPTERTGCLVTSALEVQTPGITQPKEQDVPKRLLLKLRLRESPNRKNRVFWNIGSWSSNAENHPTERIQDSEHGESCNSGTRIVFIVCLELNVICSSVSTFQVQTKRQLIRVKTAERVVF